MTGIALVGGILLPASIMRSHWFAALSMFVAVNTVLYLTLAVIKLLPKPYLSDCVPQRNRRVESRSIYPDSDRAEVEPPELQERFTGTDAPDPSSGYEYAITQGGSMVGKRVHIRAVGADKALCGETGRKVNNHGRGVPGPGLLAFTGPFGKEHTCQRCERKSGKPEILKPAKYVAARVFRGRKIHAFILGNKTMICDADGSPMLTPKAAITCEKCKKIIFGDTDGYIRGP
jgi:hypothetical protein